MILNIRRQRYNLSIQYIYIMIYNIYVYIYTYFLFISCLSLYLSGFWHAFFELNLTLVHSEAIYHSETDGSREKRRADLKGSRGAWCEMWLYDIIFEDGLETIDIQCFDMFWCLAYDTYWSSTRTSPNLWFLWYLSLGPSSIEQVPILSHLFKAGTKVENSD